MGSEQVKSRTFLGALAAAIKSLCMLVIDLARSDFRFNNDFGVAGNRGETLVYNYERAIADAGELPGLSVFVKNGTGDVFHTYSCYARGLDGLNPAYQLLDLAPKGRDEDGLPYTMSWVKHHDLYGEKSNA